MKVLCSANGASGHVIPAATLGGVFREKAEITLIAASENAVSIGELVGLSVIKETKSREIVARAHFRLGVLLGLAPDVTLVDYDPLMWAMLHFSPPKCRVSVMRPELFKGYEPLHQSLPDKFGFFDGTATANMNCLLRSFGACPIDDVRDVFVGDVVVIPGVPELDPIPDRSYECYKNTRFVYCGPLLLYGPKLNDEVIGWVEARHNDGRYVALLTLGTIWGSHIVRSLIDGLESPDLAIVVLLPKTSVAPDEQIPNRAQVFFTGWTDLVALARIVDVVIHHAGHGTTYATVLAGKQSLTLPSGEYDREDMGIRLQDLGCGRHMGHERLRQALSNRTLSRWVISLLRIANGKRRVEKLSRKIADLAEGPGLTAFRQTVGW